MSKPFITFMVSWTCSSITMSLLHWEAQSWLVTAEQMADLPWHAGSGGSSAAQKFVNNLCYTGTIAGLHPAWCPPEPPCLFLQSCFAASWLPSLYLGLLPTQLQDLAFPFCWTSWDSCWLIFPKSQGHCGVASAASPSFISPANMLWPWSNPSSGSLMKTFKSVGCVSNPRVHYQWIGSKL